MVKEDLVGQSAAWISVLRRVVELARFTDGSALIVGESGTGKELVARLIHKLDSPSSAPPTAISLRSKPKADSAAIFTAVEAAIQIAMEQEGATLRRVADTLGITDRALQMRRAIARLNNGTKGISGPSVCPTVGRDQSIKRLFALGIVMRAGYLVNYQHEIVLKALA